MDDRAETLELAWHGPEQVCTADSAGMQERVVHHQAPAEAITRLRWPIIVDDGCGVAAWHSVRVLGQCLCAPQWRAKVKCIASTNSPNGLLPFLLNLL